MPGEQITSLLPTGAGRFQDFLWPDPIGALENAVGASCRSRVAGGIAIPGVVVSFGGGIAAAVGTFQGDVYQFINGNVGIGSQRIFYPGFPVLLRTSRTPIDGLTDDCAAYRFVVVMGSSAAYGAGGEVGFQISQYNGGGGQRILTDASPGFGIDLPSGTNGIDWIVRGPNGFIRQSLNLNGQGAPFPSTYDLRVFSATATRDAYLTLAVNGQALAIAAANCTWGAGTNLPPAAIAGGSIGFAPSIVQSANNVNTLGVRSVQLIAAPTEQATL